MVPFLRNTACFLAILLWQSETAFSKSTDTFENGACNFYWKQSGETVSTACVRQEICTENEGGEGSCLYIFSKRKNGAVFLKVNADEETYTIEGMPASRTNNGSAECFITDDRELSACFESTVVALRSAAPRDTTYSNDELLYDAASIKEAQSLLYSNGYAVGSVDGKLGPETQSALRSFEKQVNVNVDGRLSTSDLQILRTGELPKPWAAIAYDANGRWFAVTGSESRSDAENSALAGIRRRSRREHKVSSIWGKGCASIASYRTKRQFGIYSGTGEDVEGAEVQLLAQCRRLSGARCQIVKTVCADGRQY